jgi:hypothetical protein
MKDLPPLSREARSSVVELLIALALDHKNDARELSSELLAELVHRRVLTQSDVRYFQCFQLISSFQKY